MNAFSSLDPVVTDVAQTLLSSPKPDRWQSVRLLTRVTPDGSTASQAFELREPSGQQVQGWYPSDAAIDHLYTQAKRHWALAQQAGQAKWYGMSITVQRDGRFAVDFEYRDDYREGDISRHG